MRHAQARARATSRKYAHNGNMKRIFSSMKARVGFTNRKIENTNSPTQANVQCTVIHRQKDINTNSPTHKYVYTVHC